MSATIALFKKEFTEQWRTSKILIVTATFFLLGMTGPVTLKLLPELLKNSTNTQGLQITLTRQMAVTDYLLNFFSQMTLLPVLVLILVAMGTVAGERERGTHVFVLTKPVSRSQFIVTKYLTYLIILAGAITLTAVGAVYYTILLAETGTVQVGPFIMTTLAMFSQMAFILAIVVLCSSLFKSAVAAGGASFVAFVIISSGSGFLPAQVSQYLPFNFLSQGREAFAGKISSSDMLIPVLSGLLLSALVIAAGCFVAEKREI